MVGVVVLAIFAAAVVVLVVFFQTAVFLLTPPWVFIVIPVGALIWFWLLTYEFAASHPQQTQKFWRSILTKLPFTIQKRVRPPLREWAKRREIEGELLDEAERKADDQ